MYELSPTPVDISDHLRAFIHRADDDHRSRGSRTRTKTITIGGTSVPVFTNEFWTSRQRQSSRLHEVSYRACFKAELPRFFISYLTKEGDVVYDPFAGRGTTLIEAALLGRSVIGNDVNPLSAILTLPRLTAPSLSDIERRLSRIRDLRSPSSDIDLSMFYNSRTLREILSIRSYLRERNRTGAEDDIDRWIRMVATNRLTGHSKGFFSVYSLPPNQAISAAKQKKINKERNQKPEYRDTRALILRKSRTLLSGLTPDDLRWLRHARRNATFHTGDARSTPGIASNSVRLVVTSPPFLNVVQYAKDNWLRCWFNHIDADDVERRMTLPTKVDAWEGVMEEVFRELFRLAMPGGTVAFEVGEVHGGKTKLEKHVIPAGMRAGFSCVGVMVNAQRFTKTANIWGISNNARGTNTNRIVIFTKG